MSDDAFRERGKALEEVFFRERDQLLLEQLRARVDAEQQKQTLSEASGIQDDAVLAALVSEGIRAETMTALSLVPLVAVAWADGHLDPKERSAILEAAQQAGIESGSVAHQLLDNWLQDEPSDALVGAWKRYVSLFVTRMKPEAAAAFQKELLARARKVAKAAGGVLGLQSISSEEQAVLDELASAFPIK